MYKSELAELARYGVRQKLAEMQQYLAKMFRDFPEEFATTAAPVFLRPDEKRNGNSWPAFTLTAPNTNGDEPAQTKRVWSPAARAKASARMLNKGEWGSVLWEQIHDYLLTQPDHQASVAVIAKALKANPASLRSAYYTHTKMFRFRDGLVQLIKPMNKSAKQAASRQVSGAAVAGVKKRMPPHKWGEKVWEQVHDFLVDQPERTAPLQAIMKQVDTKVHATVLSAVNLHGDVLERSAPGTYRLVRVLSADEKRRAESGVPDGGA